MTRAEQLMTKLALSLTPVSKAMTSRMLNNLADVDPEVMDVAKQISSNLLGPAASFVEYAPNTVGHQTNLESIKAFSKNFPKNSKITSEEDLEKRLHNYVADYLFKTRKLMETPLK